MSASGMHDLLIRIYDDEIKELHKQIAKLKQQIADRDEIINKQSMYVMETFAHECEYKGSIWYRIYRFLNW
jgi:prefoldin subunit 5